MNQKLLHKARLNSILILGWASLLVLPHSLAAKEPAKSIEEVMITLEKQEGKLQEFFHSIEDKTDYRFFYTDQGLIDDEIFKIPIASGSVADILKELAQKKKLHFRQVNNNISVRYSKKAFAAQSIEVRITPADIEVSGKVTTQEGEPLPGVAVSIAGTTVGTITNIDGDYQILAPEDGTLVISYIGFATQRVQVNSRSIINITLVEDIAALEEVVVTALGIEREAKSLGYATSSVDSEEMTINRTPNFMNALQGKVAGVNISSMSTGPAGTSKIRIRGQSSFGGQNQPLVVVNGVPVDNTNFGAQQNNRGSDAANTDRGRTRVSDGGDGLSSINPDDIESMTVLRGAAASALYGARAKDGVIMITTKQRSREEGIGVEFNTNFTTDSPVDFTDFQYIYGQGENGSRPTSPNPTSGVWSFGERLDQGLTQVLFDGVELPYVAQPSHVKTFYETGHTFTNTVTVSSGGEFGGFNLSVSNLDNKSIVPNSDYNRKTINLGFTQEIAKKLVVSGNINYSLEQIKNPPQIAEQDMSTPTTLNTLANSMPLWLMREKMADANGNEYVFSRFRNRTNPYWATFEKFDNIRKDRVFGNITARYNLTDWLFVQGRIGQDFYARDQEYNFPTGTASLPNAPEGFVNGEYVQDNRRFREVNADFLIGANHTFGDFAASLTLGGNQMYRRMDRNNVLVNDFVVRDLYTVMNGRIKDPIYEISERQVNSLYGMMELSYKDYLFLNGTVRNDWFSTLSPQNRSILYPSVTGSFVFSQPWTNFPEWISFGKIRAGYAEVGSDTDVSPYADNLFYRVENNQFPNPSGQMQPIGIINASTVPNANLRPMRVSEWETGLEMKFFNNRLGLDLTYYNKLTTDQILGAQVSDASGYTNQLVNVGESQNKGLEVLLSGVPVQAGSFMWETSINASYNQTETLRLGLTEGDSVITVGAAIFGGELRQVVGQPMGQIYGFGYLRDPEGNMVFDANNGRPLRTPLQIPFGSAIPVWVGGFMNTFHYKNLSLSMLIDFKLGHKLLSGTNFNVWRHGLHKGTLEGREEGFVIGDGVKIVSQERDENGQVINTVYAPNDVQAETQTFYETVRSANMVEEFIYNAGYWNLRQVSLGYNFTPHLPENFFIRNLRLNIVGNNVLFIKKWTPNIHPEQLGFASDNLIGMEAHGLPITRSIGFNLNFKF
ncbi:TonB-linked outer membrane protein, SusC/RagA family [Cyclobacterium lianum]|uniref:TonB-linked outer membrane protein, SusC/RagA family n=1 Tax=Cyclobacterium lianum TaxID=388280 RepID=A0A1M7L673_9BACT|nr:SusC/RagA family TonB-linked outer membrane protein [Cyclobacterium lianum]SHM73374.1 TonB-linked outer membrane protein, SusC/RagA family [Cyclobacterium lianum]